MIERLDNMITMKIISKGSSCCNFPKVLSNATVAHRRPAAELDDSSDKMRLARFYRFCRFRGTS